MTDNNLPADIATPAQPEPIESTPPTPEIETIHIGTCPSLSQRSTLTYAIGRDAAGELYLAITGNSGAGMYCTDFAPASAIDTLVVNAQKLTSSGLHSLHPNRSKNMAGFILAVLVDLQLVRRHPESPRHCQHIPGTTFASCVQVKWETKPKRKNSPAKESA